ncbi:hypothetical protein [Amycolatopsis saalfeldensis]|uniref:Uncharacterized protein n=1 Tax=Amycolatopsis saalfeldensis TaxID=394193 RepID=A0A1H8YI19_9PSEU|nr:hypothetical protein [Amycolatopsis saalfeldensis]SEP51840.1 hypothetical protein SAMN04489732_117158 [Amycolatopsis saalfeldensis]
MARARKPVSYQPIPPDLVARIRRSARPVGLGQLGLTIVTTVAIVFLAVRWAPRLPLTGMMVGLQAAAVIEGFAVAVIVLSLPEHVASGYLDRNAGFAARRNVIVLWLSGFAETVLSFVILPLALSINFSKVEISFDLPLAGLLPALLLAVSGGFAAAFVRRAVPRLS